jgi:ABC-2 type transport system ATP-binding protein
MRREFNRDLITHLQGEGRTIFYSSHLLSEVEAVADSVAIIDRGRIVKHAPTERLRQQVQRIVFSAAAYEQVADVLHTLDLRRSGGEVAVTVENAPRALAMLEPLGIEHRVQPLNLDDIFEAYVAGNTSDAGAPPMAEAVPR